MRIKRAALLTAIFLVLLVGHSLAYILPPGQVLGLMIKRYRGLKSLSAEGQVEVIASGAQDRVSLPMRLYAQGPEMFRVEIQTRSGTRVTVINGNSGATLVDGELLGEVNRLKSAFLSIFFHKSLGPMMDALEAEGVDLMAVGLGRFLLSPAFIIGAQSPREPKPSLWVDKGTLRPVRVVLSYAADRADEEIQYLDYLTLKGGVALPSVVEFLKEGGLVKRFVIKRYSLNPSLSSNLFSVESLTGIGRAGRPR